MSLRPNTPMFLQRAGYRQRRLRDASKLVPVLGVLLLVLPLAWPVASQPEAESIGASGLIYIFGVWFVLIVLTALLTSRLRSIPELVKPSDTSSE